MRAVYRAQQHQHNAKTIAGPNYENHEKVKLAELACFSLLLCCCCLVLLLQLVRRLAATDCAATVCCLGIAAAALRLTAAAGVAGLPLLLVRCLLAFFVRLVLFAVSPHSPSYTARRVSEVSFPVYSPQTQRSHDGKVVYFFFCQRKVSKNSSRQEHSNTPGVDQNIPIYIFKH